MRALRAREFCGRFDHAFAMVPLMGERITRDVTARGIRMRVVEAGAGPPVVLIHDFLVNHLEFEHVIGPLAARFRVLAPDLPGFGESEKPSPARYGYGIESFAEALVDMIAGLELGRVCLVGHSLGGAVAITLAAEHPELVEKLVLVDAMSYPFLLDFRSRLPLLPFLGGLIFKQMYGRGGFRRHFRDNVFSPGFSLPVDKIDRYYDQFNTPAARESAHAVLQASRDTRPIVARIPRITAPTLVVWGRSDRMFPASFGQRLAREIAGARFDVLDAGHSPNEECPDAFVHAVSRFLPRT
jgi:pimeloyl-ACP methyl ester carboxylesterase